MQDLRPLGALCFAGFAVFGLWSFSAFVAESQGHRTGSAGFATMLIALACLFGANTSLRTQIAARLRADAETGSRARGQELADAMATLVQQCVDATTECETTMKDGLQRLAKATDEKVSWLIEQFNAEESKQDDLTELLRRRIEFLEARCAALEAARANTSTELA